MGKLKNIEIANALNISTAAVSMALNNKPGVSDETRQKVLAYYAQHSDTTSLVGMGTVQKMLILDIYKDSGNIIIDKPFFSEIMSSIHDEATKHGYILIVSQCNRNTDMKEHVESLNLQSASGVILLATELTTKALMYYQNLSVPYVLLDGYSDEIFCDSVSLDNCNAIFRAYKYAFNMGHRNIGYLKCSTKISNFTHRFDGFIKARQTFEPELAQEIPVVFSLPSNIKDANLYMKKTLETLPADFKMPSCFLSYLYFIAIGAMLAFTDHGYKIPDDISLIGYDDISLSAISSPPLTTIHLHQRTLAREAVALLLKKIQNPDLCPMRISLNSDLVIRNSVSKYSPL